MDGTGRLTCCITAVAVAALAACTSTVPGRGAHSTPSSVAGPAPTSTPRGCATARALPDPRRPHMHLTFDVADDLHTVRGTEVIDFRPDKPITELVFRLTANTRPTVDAGSNIVVTSASGDHGAGRATYSQANAAPSTQGGLLHIPFRARIAAGTTVTAHIGFTVTLGGQSFDRFGRTSSYAWFASAQPLLAWERGFGWHGEDMIDFPAESATSEAMDVSLTVRAPARDTVIMSGDPGDPAAAATGSRTWTSTISAARDVSVAVGPFAVSDTLVDGVKLRVGAPTASSAGGLVPEFERALRALAARFGRFPFPSLSVARLPVEGGGIEYPSSILMLNSSRLVSVHETAHQWFYAMVGDSQALHPWLDEAFAQYAEQLVNDDAPHDDALHAPGPVDASTESYGVDESAYYFTTYNKGAAALLAARDAAGPARWDAALRCYVAANAWRIAAPADFAAAIAQLPKGVAVLRQAGAIR